MRYERREKILEIIKTQEVDTQEKLVSLLKDYGFKVTQATISRDIRELQLVKTTNKSGKNCYTLPETINRKEQRYDTIFRHTVLDIKSAGNLVVVKTLSGCANATAEAIDTSENPEILGTIAGDNTILIIVDKPENTDSVVARCKASFEENI